MHPWPHLSWLPMGEQVAMGPPVLAGWGPPSWDVVREMGMPTAGVPVLLSGEELVPCGSQDAAGARPGCMQDGAMSHHW